MLRMPTFALLQPTTLDEALSMLAAHPGAQRLAGGTDLLPALKSGKTAASTVVALGAVEALRGITRTDDHGLRIGALTTLHALANDATVLARAPALAEAAGHAASPQIRRRATLAGNLLLDTRCRYVDQSALFRQALGGCLKSHGVECHVVPGGRSCVAALCADTVAPLVALGASVEITGPAGTRRLPLLQLYRPDGRHPHRLEEFELVVAVHLPAAQASTIVVARRWALRQAIDFPLLSMAATLTFDRAVVSAAPANHDAAPGRVGGDDGARNIIGGNIIGGSVVVTTLGPQPRVTSLATFAGRPWTAATQAEIVAAVSKRSQTMPNLPFDAAYRQQRLQVELARMLASVADPTSAQPSGA